MEDSFPRSETGNIGNYAAPDGMSGFFLAAADMEIIGAIFETAREWVEMARIA
jgi:hypothetical protein